MNEIAPNPSSALIDPDDVTETKPPASRRLIPMIGNYPDYANPDLVEAIPLSARTILDVGCGGGAVGAAYRQRNPRARILGIESDPISGARAAERLDAVQIGDVEATPMPFDLPNGLDCLIYGDALEHMRDPWSLLRSQAASLNDDGAVVMCFPNVEHFSIVFRLLNGSFDYDPEGLLDRTHLRWFTPRMMARAVSDAGLALCDIRPRPTDPTGATRFVEAMRPALAALGVDPGDYLNRAAPVQFILRAKKAPRPRLVVNASMLPPIGGVSDVRVVEPIRAISTDASVLASIRTEPDFATLLPEAPHIAVLHRPLLLGDAGIGRVRSLIERGFLVVTEFDDHPVFMEKNRVPSDQLFTFTATHAIQTSTEPLAEALSAFNPEIAVFPNAISALSEPVNFTNPERMTLFFAALNREEDWAPLMPALNEVLRAVGARLAVTVLHDQGFFDALDTPHKNFLPTTDYPSYQAALARSEICFMPLGDTLFNRAKSDLKFIEASAARVVSLASPVVYENSLIDGQTGLLFRSPDALRMQLLRLLAYPDAAQRMANAARDYVARERMLAYQTRARIDWYRSLWDRRDALTEALRARMPRLFG